MIFNKKLSLFLSGITGINNIMIRKKNSKSLMQTLFKISLILLSKIGLKFNAFFFSTKRQFKLCLAKLRSKNSDHSC